MTCRSGYEVMARPEPFTIRVLTAARTMQMFVVCPCTATLSKRPRGLGLIHHFSGTTLRAVTENLVGGSTIGGMKGITTLLSLVAMGGVVLYIVFTVVAEVPPQDAAAATV